MKIKTILAAAVISTGFLHSGAVVAQDLVNATDPAQIQNLASGYGSAQLTTDRVGDPMVRGRVDGVQYVIFFYGCTDGTNCRSISFSSYWTGKTNITCEKLAEWNQQNRFGYAYLDTDGDPRLELDVNLFEGVSIKNLDDTIDWWVIKLKQFDEFLS